MMLIRIATSVSLLAILVAAVMAPGLVWFRGVGLPAPFRAFAFGMAWTTLSALALAALECFSFTGVVLVNCLTAVLGVAHALFRKHEKPSAFRSGWTATASISALAFLAALAIYWPPYETHFAGSDASTYVGAGSALKRTGKLVWQDDLGPVLTRDQRQSIFRSVFGATGFPPFHRYPGGLSIHSPQSNTFRPSFFPAPMVWSGLFASALGPTWAGGFAPVFAAGAIWAIALFLMARMVPTSAAMGAALVAVSAPCMWAAQLPMADALGWFFVWAFLVAMDAFEKEGSSTDAAFAAFLAGMGMVCRVELLLFLSAAVVVRLLLAPWLKCRTLPPVFFGVWGLMLGLTLLEALAFRGAHTLPITQLWMGIQLRIGRALGFRLPWELIFSGGLTVLAASLYWRPTWARIAAFVATPLAAGAFYVYSDVPVEPMRSLEWLEVSLDWPVIALAPFGALAAWLTRDRHPGNGFFLIVVGIVGGIVMYNPHAIPLLPWATRRLAGMVAPACIVAAAIALENIPRLARLPKSLEHLSMVKYVGWAVLAVTISLPAGILWDRSIFLGTHAELERLERWLPDEGTLLIDSRLELMLFGAPLFLEFGRTSLPVRIINEEDRQVMAGIVRRLFLAKRGPVYLLSHDVRLPEKLGGVAATPLKQDSYLVVLPKQSTTEMPKGVDQYRRTVGLFRLGPKWGE